MKVKEYSLLWYKDLIDSWITPKEVELGKKAARDFERRFKHKPAEFDPALKKELNDRRDHVAAGYGELPPEASILNMEDLVALAKTRKRTKRGRPPGIKGKIDGKTWSYKSRVEALTVYLTLGSAAATAEHTGIPAPTIREWTKKPWWNQLAEEIRKEKEAEIDAKLTALIDKTLSTLENRLTEGEVVYNPRTGEQIRVPVKTIDAVRIFDKVHEKRALTRGDPTKRVETITTEQRLESLANQFTKFGKGEVIVDGEYEEVIEESTDAYPEEGKMLQSSEYDYEEMPEQEGGYEAVESDQGESEEIDDAETTRTE